MRKDAPGKYKTFGIAPLLTFWPQYWGSLDPLLEDAIHSALLFLIRRNGGNQSQNWEACLHYCFSHSDHQVPHSNGVPISVGETGFLSFCICPDSLPGILILLKVVDCLVDSTSWHPSDTRPVHQPAWPPTSITEPVSCLPVQHPALSIALNGLPQSFTKLTWGLCCFHCWLPTSWPALPAHASRWRPPSSRRGGSTHSCPARHQLKSWTVSWTAVFQPEREIATHSSVLA